MTLIEAAQQGDEAASAALVSRYRGFVRCKARSYFLAALIGTTVVQEGMIGLYKGDPGLRSYPTGELPLLRGTLASHASSSRRSSPPVARSTRR